MRGWPDFGPPTVLEDLLYYCNTQIVHATTEYGLLYCNVTCKNDGL